jgi:hypothetical protein
MKILNKHFPNDSSFFNYNVISIGRVILNDNKNVFNNQLKILRAVQNF